MSHKNLQELIKNLQEFYKCPSCETNYHFEDIRFLGEIEVYCFVQLTCHECSLPLLATDVVSGTLTLSQRFRGWKGPLLQVVRQALNLLGTVNDLN